MSAIRGSAATLIGRTILHIISGISSTRVGRDEGWDVTILLIED